MSRNIPSVLVALHLLFYNFVTYVIQVSRTAYIKGGGEGFVAAKCLGEGYYWADSVKLKAAFIS